LLSPWERWDVSWYVRILDEGYRSGNGTDAFHPLFPWLARPLTYVGLEPVLALMLVALAASMAFVVVFRHLAAMDSSPGQVETATLLLLFFPIAFVLFAPYTEGLFLFFAASTLWLARRRRWWWAGFAGAFAVLTRQQGVLLLLPFAWELWEAHRRNVWSTLRDWRTWTASGLIPGALVSWGLYRVLVVGGTQLDPTTAYTLVHSLFFSPSAGMVGAEHVFTWPWHALWLALARVWAMPDLDLLVNLALSAAFLVAVVLAWPHMHAAHRVYVVGVVWISLSYHTGYAHPYMGLPRHLFLAFPVFMGLGQVAEHRRSRLILVGSGFVGFCFLTCLYALEAWVP